MIISPSQAWGILRRHAESDVGSLGLAELRRDGGRREEGGPAGGDGGDGSGSFVTVHNSDDGGRFLMLDWSRQRMAPETIGHLMRLSAALQIRERIRDLAWGRLAPSSKLRVREAPSFAGVGGDYGAEGLMSSPTVSFDLRGSGRQQHSRHEHDGDEDDEGGGSMHLALRAPANKGLFMRDPYSYPESRRTNGKPAKNALDEIHSEWDRIRAITESLRRGTTRGASGRPLCDVLVLSPGGTVVPCALEFIYRALMHNDEAELAASVDSNLLSVRATTVGVGGGTQSKASTLQSTAGGVISMVTTPFRSKSAQDLHGHASPSGEPRSSSSAFRRRKLRVLTSTDPGFLKEVLSELSPATTMVVTLDTCADTDRELKDLNSTIRRWLLSSISADAANHGSKESGSGKKQLASAVAKKHVFLVTSKEVSKTSVSDNTFLIPRHSRCEAFGTFTAAGLLPLSLVFGWDVVSSILTGAHDIDGHFVDTNPRHNLPVVSALVDLWNDAFLGSGSRVLAPHDRALGSYPAFVAALENRALGGPVGRASVTKPGHAKKTEGPSPIIDGGSSSFEMESRALPTEFMLALDPNISGISVENGALSSQDERVCSLLAHADALAFGSGNNNGRRFELSSPGSPPMIQSVDSMLSQTSVARNDTATPSGNQPSSLLVCGTLDAFACGQLVALAEHRALVKAWLWDVDPFRMSSKSALIQAERQAFLSDKLNRMNHLLSVGEDLDEADDTLFPSQSGANGPDKSSFVHPATKMILKNYATRMQNQRHDSLPRTPLRG